MPALSAYLWPIALLVGSNVFMTIAWYWHLRFKEVPLFSVIPISWALAFVEYCFGGAGQSLRQRGLQSGAAQDLAGSHYADGSFVFFSDRLSERSADP